MTGHRLARMRYGRWVIAEGARFNNLVDKPYTEGGHRFRFYEEWPNGLPSSFNIILGIDWGTRAPYCCLWIAIDFDGNPWVFREDYRPGLTSDIQGREIVKLTKDNERIRYAYADPSCWNKRKTQEGSVQKSDAEYYEAAFNSDSLNRFGPLIKGYNESRRIALGTIDSLLNKGNGYPDIRIEEGCVNLWKELTEAVWDSRGLNDKKEDIDPSCSDHALTSLYYALHTYYDSAETIPKPFSEISVEDMQKAKAQKEIEDATRSFTRQTRRSRI